MEIGIYFPDMEANEVVEEELEPRRALGDTLHRGHFWT
jgi:hypothetical protein